MDEEVRDLADRWGLALGEELTGGFRAEVYACTDADGRELVLKRTPEPVGAVREAAALRAWERTGAAIRLVDVDGEIGATLLQRVRPGTPLPPGDDDAAVEVVATLLGAIHVPAPVGSELPPLAVAYGNDEARAIKGAEEGTEGIVRIEAARAAAMWLCETAGEEVLLHGDLLDKNILRGGERYVVIDPMPRVGDPCADIGFFATGHPPATAIVARARRIAGRLGRDEERAVRWAAVWAVGEGCETWRDDSDDLQAWLAGGEVDELLRTR